MFVVMAASSVFPQSFTKITAGDPVTDVAASRSVNWIDYDRDGDLDLFVSRGKAGGENNILYRNDGAPAYTFTKMSSLTISQDGTPSDGATWGDYDNDGDDDAFVVNWYGINNLMYRNEGDGSFTQILSGSQVTDGGYSETATWGDYNNDGFVDLYVTNSSGVLNNFLYRNLGDGSFQRIVTGSIVNDGGHSRGANWVDYDNDHDLDLFVANESNENEFLYKNLLTETGIDSFVRITADPLVTNGATSWSGSWGDYDNDGDLDVFIANNSGQNNNLFVNQGDGSFFKLPVNFGDVVDDSGASASSGWGDIDNDGDLDLLVTNAYGLPQKSFLYLNRLTETGSAIFDRVFTGNIVNDLGYNYGFAWGDYDEDGDLDAYVARTINEAQANAFYRNDGNSNHWLKIDCRGTVSNASGIGARVKVKATVNGIPVWQMRVVEGQSGYCGQNLQLHFGLESSQLADSIIIDWPSGIRDTFVAVPANHHYVIAENQSVTPAQISPPHEATGQLPSTTFRWHRSLVGAPYRLQIGTDSTFTSGIIFEDSTLTDTVITVDSLPNYNTLYWRIQESRTIHRNIWSAVRKFTVGAATFDYAVQAKWNIVSVPVVVAQYTVGYIFPTALTSAYSFVNGSTYEEKDTLIPGVGYWTKFPSAQNFQIPGVERGPDTVTVAAGWNLVGSRGDVIPAAAIASIPDGIINSLFYGYQQGYYSAESIEPFHGYWVKASAPGQIIINDSVPAAANKYAKAIPAALNRLSIEDANGNIQVLYFSGNNDLAHGYELPPSPPAGVFDARFASGKFIENAGAEYSEGVPIVVSSAVYPVRIGWEMRENAVSATLNINSKPVRLNMTGTFSIAQQSNLELHIGRNDDVPYSYRLGQNYPNPFNPATLIQYSLAEDTRVTLKVYDILGREVVTLVDEHQVAGLQSVRMDAGILAGGVYTYRLVADEYTETKKMIVMK
jgi:hypothetical protein